MTGLGTEAEGCQSLSEDMAGRGERTEMKYTQRKSKRTVVCQSALQKCQRDGNLPQERWTQAGEQEMPRGTICSKEKMQRLLETNISKLSFLGVLVLKFSSSSHTVFNSKT